MMEENHLTHKEACELREKIKELGYVSKTFQFPHNESWGLTVLGKDPFRNLKKSSNT